jgi:plastocyanin
MLFSAWRRWVNRASLPGRPRRRGYRPELLCLEDRTVLTTFTVHVGPASNFMTFSPASQTINVGDTVHWVWDTDNHSTTSGTCSGGGTCTPDGKWDSGVHDSGFTFDHTFNQAGTFPYFCLIHGPSGMTGTVVVKASSGSKPPTITRVAPARAVQGQAQLTLSVTGTGFSAGSVVRVNGHPLTTTFVSRRKLQVANFLEQVQAALMKGHGRFSLTVFTPGQGKSAAFPFVVRPPGGLPS